MRYWKLGFKLGDVDVDVDDVRCLIVPGKNPTPERFSLYVRDARDWEDAKVEPALSSLEIIINCIRNLRYYELKHERGVS
jgi:hypothetical protein